jgi:hypothetical protein
MRRHAAGSFLLVALCALPVVLGCADDEGVEHGPATAALVPPVLVTGPDPIDVEVGAIIDVVSDGVERVDTSDDAVLSVTQPSDDGSAQFNAGATAVAEGDAVLSVYGEDDELLYEVDVTVG